MKRTRQGIVIPKSSAELVRRAKAELTVSPIVLNQVFPKRFKMFREDATSLVVPVFYVPQPSRPPQLPVPHAARLAFGPFGATLKPELQQPAAVDAVLESLDSTGGAVLSLATGMGKTTCALYVAAKLGLRTLVLVHKEFLAQQWTDRARALLPGVTVTRVQGGTCDTSGDIVVGMLQTLTQRVFQPSVFENIGLLVVDEVHHIAAEIFSKAMFGLAMPKVLGLSATPTRKDGLTKVIHWFFGPTTYVGARAAVDVSVIFVKYKPAIPIDMPLNRRGDICYASLTSLLVKDHARTALIVDHIIKVYGASGRDILVLSHRRAHCKAIEAALLAKNVDAKCFIGGDGTTPPASRVVVSTYALTSEGFDLPRLSVLVLATPASDVVQAAGRVLRNPAQPALIVDIADDFPIAYAQLAKRKAFYKASKFAFEGRHTAPAALAPPPQPTRCLFLED